MLKHNIFNKENWELLHLMGTKPSNPRQILKDIEITEIVFYGVILLMLFTLFLTLNKHKFNENTILSGELLNKRTYSSKTFINSDGSYSIKTYPYQIHYLDKETKQFKDIDHTLRWNMQRRGWYFKTHNFFPFLPEYADQWIEFHDVFEDKDQTIKYKPLSNHIKGRLITTDRLGEEGLKGLTPFNCVIYDNAFSQGIDLILYFTETSFIKAVRIGKDYKGSNDMSFDFEIVFPPDKDIYTKSNNKLINIDLLADKQYLSVNPLVITSKEDKRHKMSTYLNLQVWDEKIKEAIKFRIFDRNGHIYLRKILDKEFLNKSIGDVFTDTETIYY